MNYTIVNLEQDIAEIICQSESKDSFLELSHDLKVVFLNFVITQIKPFLLGRYGMDYKESGEVLSKFPQGLVTEDSFMSKVVENVKIGSVKTNN